jgi:hypothetical protein
MCLKIPGWRELYLDIVESGFPGEDCAGAWGVQRQSSDQGYWAGWASELKKKALPFQMAKLRLRYKNIILCHVRNDWHNVFLWCLRVLKLAIMGHTCNPTTLEAEPGGLWIRIQSGLHIETLSQKKKRILKLIKKTHQLTWAELGTLFLIWKFFSLFYLFGFTKGWWYSTNITSWFWNFHNKVCT